MGTVAAGQVWVVARDSDDRTTCKINGVYSTRSCAIAACRTADDAVVRFEIGRDMTDVNDIAEFDSVYPLRR